MGEQPDLQQHYWQRFLTHIEKEEPALAETLKAATMKTFGHSGVILKNVNGDCADIKERLRPWLWMWFGCPSFRTISLEGE